MTTNNNWAPHKPGIVLHTLHAAQLILTQHTRSSYIGEAPWFEMSLLSPPRLFKNCLPFKTRPKFPTFCDAFSCGHR